MTTFLAQVRAHEISAVGKMRQNPNYTVAESENEIWLRCNCEGDEPSAELRSLPCTLFRLSGEGDLIPWQLHVPLRKLPHGINEKSWQPLSDWLQVVPPIPALAGQFERNCLALRFDRSATVSDPNLMITDITGWKAYAIAAPKVRLDRLSFAMNENGGVVIRGEPLPPIPGRRFVETNGIAVEAGWEYFPPVEPALLAKSLNLATGDIALLLRDDPWEQIPCDTFVQATRTAVRLSAVHLSKSSIEGQSSE